VGDTVRDPDVGTAPIPGVISALSASVEVQLKVAFWPRSMEVGDTVILAAGRVAGSPPGK
jgi:hypothetical protein